MHRELIYSMIPHWLVYSEHYVKNGFEYLKEVNAAKIHDKWKINIPVDKSSGLYDFIVNNGKEWVIFETNYYGGGYSKLESTAGE